MRSWKSGFSRRTSVDVGSGQQPAGRLKAELQQAGLAVGSGSNDVSTRVHALSPRYPRPALFPAGRGHSSPLRAIGQPLQPSAVMTIRQDGLLPGFAQKRCPLLWAKPPLPASAIGRLIGVLPKNRRSPQLFIASGAPGAIHYFVSRFASDVWPLRKLTCEALPCV